MQSIFSNLLYILTLSPFHGDSELWAIKKGVNFKENEKLSGKRMKEDNINPREFSPASISPSISMETGGRVCRNLATLLPSGPLNRSAVDKSVAFQPKNAHDEMYHIAYVFAPLNFILSLPGVVIASIFLNVTGNETLVFLYGLSTLSFLMAAGSSAVVLFLGLTNRQITPLLVVSSLSLLFGNVTLFTGILAWIFFLIFPLTPTPPKAVVLLVPTPTSAFTPTRLHF